jgi:hypothetical protein
VEDEAKATVEDNTEMEAQEDGENGVMQEAIIVGETENNRSLTDESDKSDRDSDY